MRHLLIGLLAMLVFLLVIAAAESYGQTDETLPLPPLPAKPDSVRTPPAEIPPPTKPSAEPAKPQPIPAPAAGPSGPQQPRTQQPARAAQMADDAALEAVYGAKAAAEMKAARAAEAEQGNSQETPAKGSPAGADTPSEPPTSIDRLPARQSFSFNSLYDGRMQRNPIGTYTVRSPDEAPWINDPIGNGDPTADTGILRRSSSLYRGKSSLFRDRYNRNPVDQRLLDQGYGVTGKLPILPQKPDPSITDAAGNMLPSRDPRRNLSGPTLGNARTTRNPINRNRLSPTQRIQDPLYRGPSRPGMIAPRAQQERLTPNARRLGNPR